MGWENKFHCEWNEFGQKILKYYWPNAKSYNDITKTDFTIHRGVIDLISGGFPCQPYSIAGKRKGKEDDRHLWPEMLRAIREIQPTWVVSENVSGLINWNGGMVFDEVQTDLEAQGYEVIPFILPAAAVNAPHRRDRVWFVAKNTMHSECVHGRNEQERTEVWEQRNTCTGNSNWFCVSKGDATNTESFCIQGQRTGPGKRKFGRGDWCWFPTQSPICDGDDGISDRLDSITFSKWRNESIKAGGNAIVPQVALQIFKAIEQFEQLK